MSTVELCHVDIEYHAGKKTFTAVYDVSLSVRAGEIIVLMGLSGSGKSTLLRSMNGLVKPSKGCVKINGQDIVTCSLEKLRQLRMTTVSMVFQQAALLPWRTVTENVQLGLELQGVEHKEEIAQRNLDIVGLGDWARCYPAELSGGMQQRVGLARALATQADILLMDEPFSALDPLIRAQLQQELLRLQSQLKKTIVFVSHDLDEALRLGNRVAIMEAGKIVQIGTPHEITSNPINDYVKRFVGSIEKHCPRCAESASLPVL